MKAGRGHDFPVSHLGMFAGPFLCEIGQDRKEFLGEVIIPSWLHQYPPQPYQLAPHISRGECGPGAVPRSWDGCHSLSS